MMTGSTDNLLRLPALLEKKEAGSCSSSILPMLMSIQSMKLSPTQVLS
jgi:hypothetical protein